MVHFIEEIRRKTTNINFSTNVLEKIIKNNVDKQIYKNLKIQVLMKDHTVNEIVLFFIKNYCNKNLTRDIIKYHQKIGTLKFYFKNEDHNNLDMEKSVTVIQLVELHMVGLNSVIMAKNLYEEYMKNSDNNFQNDPLSYDYIASVAESILPNSLYNELINNINDNYQKQINWIIEKLE